MAKSKGKKSAKGSAGKVAKGYRHPDQTLLMRPEVGTQAQFRKKKPPQTYRYDSSGTWHYSIARKVEDVRRALDGFRARSRAIETAS